MAIDADEYLKIKKQIEKKQKEINRAEGVLEQIMKELKTKYNCTSIAGAKSKHEKLKRKLKETEKEYDSAVASFKKKWKEELDE